MRRRNKLRTCMHLVWATKFRTPLITPEIERRVFAVIESIFRDNKCSVLAINGMPDHVHILIVLPTTIALGTLLGRVKGGSSRIISEEITPDSWFAWQPNYAAFSVSESHRERVIRYITNQKRHHAEKSLWAEAEETDEEDVEYGEES